MKRVILVTGGAGYIGSHTCVQLLERGFNVVVLDNYCNSTPEALKRVEQITGKFLIRIEGDVRDPVVLNRLFAEHAFEGVMHFAGLKAVGESADIPLTYYDVNVSGSVALLKAMLAHGVTRFIFSSSATVYGDPQYLPLDEQHRLDPVNPYGRSKFMAEEILRDFCRAQPSWSVAILRYFNPVGAHESGLIGEDPRGTPNNLMPYVAQVAVGRREALNVFGQDYDTPDGTGIRDFIHVTDLARGHVLALEALLQTEGLLTLNLGTGTGSSVLDLVAAFSKASGRDIPYQIQPRRVGDVAVNYADCRLAYERIGFKTERTLDDMCNDSWRWQSNNPSGYGT